MIRPEVRYDSKTGEKYVGFQASIPFETVTAFFTKLVKRVGGFLDRTFADMPKLTPLGPVRKVKASIFAGPTDVRRYRAAKAAGMSDNEAFKVGDNGIGCYGDNTAGNVCWVALPPEVMIDEWGSVLAAKHKPVRVWYQGLSVDAAVGDRMPHLAKIENGCRIDLNWATAQALGIKTEQWTGSVEWQPLQSL